MSKPEILLTTRRNDYIDLYYFGSIYLANSKKICYKIGLDISEICFMRSLAKPLQASIICDYNIINDYKLNTKELAMFLASHAGSKQHIKILKILC